MPKTKAAKRFSKHQAASIKQNKFVGKVKKSQKIKEKKLLERDFSDSDNEADQREERHLSLVQNTLKSEKSKNEPKKKNDVKKSSTEQESKAAKSKKHEVTAEEISAFWKKLETAQGEEVEADEEAIEALISNVQDDFDVIEADKSGKIQISNIDADEEEGEDNMEDEKSDSNEDEESEKAESSEDEEFGEDADDVDDDSEDSDDVEAAEDNSNDNDESASLEGEEDSPEASSNKQEAAMDRKFANLFGVRMSLKSQSSEYVKRVLITKELCQTWIESIQEGKRQYLKQMLVAFYTASLQFGERTSEEETAYQLSPFRIDSPSVYMRIVLGALRFAPEAFWSLLGIPSTTTTQPNKLLLKKKKILALVTLFCKSSLRVFTYTSKADALRYALQYLVGGLPFFGSNIISSKLLIKIVLKLLQHSDEIVRVRAFVVLHEIASKFPKPIPDLVLKGAYYSYFEFASECTPDNVKRLEFYRNCITEIYGVNFDLSYKHAHSYIRGLAETFQAATKNSSVQARKSMINWRYMNCLECWTQVLSTYHAANELGDLVFPLTQLIMGLAVLFKENALWTPFKLKLARQLNQLSAASGRFIPSSVILLSMLKERQVVENKTQTSVTPIDFEFKIRVSDKIVRTVEFQRAALNEWIYLVAGTLIMHAKSIAFPEVSHPILRAIVTFRHEYFGRRVFGTSEKRKKVMSDAKFLESIKKLQKAIEEQSNLVLQKRSRLTFSPQEILQKKEGSSESVFDTGFISPFEKYYNSLKKDHDADVLRKLMSYQQAIQDKSKKDGIDVEIEKTIKSNQKELKKELAAKLAKAEISENSEGKSRKRKRDTAKGDREQKRSKSSAETTGETKNLNINSFFS